MCLGKQEAQVERNIKIFTVSGNTTMRRLELVDEEKSSSPRRTQENNKKSDDCDRSKERDAKTLREVDEKNFYGGECTLVELAEGSGIGPRCRRHVTRTM